MIPLKIILMQISHMFWPLVMVIGILAAGCGNAPTTASCTGVLCGTWVSAYTGSSAPYSKHTFTVSSASEMTYLQAQYSNSTCTTPGGANYNYTFTYSIGSAAPSPSGATQVDLTYVTLTETPVDAATVTNFNAGSVCGFSNWVLNTPKSLFGSSCASTINAGTINYNIFQITGTTLQLGDESGANNGTTTALRPTALSSNPTLTKQ